VAKAVNCMGDEFDASVRSDVEMSVIRAIRRLENLVYSLYKYRESSISRFQIDVS
jgi:hypothetical protein